MQHDSKQDNKNKQPHAIDSKLISTHEILTKVHTLEIKQSKSVHHRYLNVSEIGKFVPPHLPHNHCHQIKHQNVTEDQIKQVGSRDSDQLEEQGHSPRYCCELNQVEHVHQHQDRIKELCQPVHPHEIIRVNICVLPQQEVDILSHGEHHEERKVINVEERHHTIPDELENITEGRLVIVVQEETDIVVLLLAVVDRVQRQLDGIEDQQRLPVVVCFDTCFFQGLRVARGLIRVQSESLEVGTWAREYLFSLNSIFVKDLDIDPPIGSREIHSHFDVQAPCSISEEHFKMTINQVSKILRSILTWECIDNIALTSEYSILSAD